MKKKKTWLKKMKERENKANGIAEKKVEKEKKKKKTGKIDSN